MKNLKLIIVALVAFANGLVANFLFQPKEKADPNVAPIENAQELVNNFSGQNKYYTLTDETFKFLKGVKDTAHEGEGYVIYYGATEADTMCNMLIAARIDGHKNVVSGYFATPIRKSYGNNCPMMCDVQNGLELP